MLGIFGGADTSIPVAEVRQMEAQLNQLGIANQISIYDRQPHAFVKSIDEIRQGGPQQQAWAELLAFLKQSLTPSADAPWQPAPRASYDAPVALSTFSPARAMHVFVCDRAVRPA